MATNTPVQNDNGTTAPVQPVNGNVYRRTTVEQPPAGYQNTTEYAPAPVVGTMVGPAPNVDRTRWGPIWAGFVSTIAVFLIAESLLLWLGVLGLTANGSGGMSMNRPWVTWIIAVASFFVGGIVTAVTNPVRGSIANALNGFLVWAVATAVIGAASVMGAGAIFGTVGALVGHVLHMTGSSGSTVNSGSVSSLKSAAGWAFWTLLSTAIAAMLGGFIAGFGRPVGYVEDTTGNYTK